MAIKTTETALVNLLKTIPELKAVTDHEPKNLLTLPAATLYLAEFSEQPVTVAQYQLQVSWFLRIYVSLQDAKTAQDSVKTIIEAILAKVRQDPTLGGVCRKATVGKGEVLVVQDQRNPLLLIEMTVEMVNYETR